ncbi:hypothetical protein, partial [Synechococcus sp. MIT S9509]|uniref:hypothetical protein n=1 Tax=Synechococcus sp. MIT S9509 TaxID=1801630 RepID=UPI0012E88671
MSTSVHKQLLGLKASDSDVVEAFASSHRAVERIAPDLDAVFTRTNIQHAVAHGPDIAVLATGVGMDAHDIVT